MNCKEFYFKGEENLDIHVYKWSHEEIEPKAVIQIAHGMMQGLMVLELYLLKYQKQ